MLFEKFVQQHRVYSFITNGVRLSLWIVSDQRRIHLFYFFGNQTKLQYPGWIEFRFVSESDRFQTQDNSLAVSSWSISRPSWRFGSDTGISLPLKLGNDPLAG